MTQTLCVVCDTVSPGKTVWTSARSTWSGRRNLINADNNNSLAMDRVDVNASLSVLQYLSSSSSVSLSSDEGLLSTLPSWCLFQGMIRCCTDH